MRTILPKIILAAFLLVMLTAAGCVAPPQGSATTGPVDLYDPNQFSSITPEQIPNIIVDATPFQTAVTTKPAYNVMEITTTIPEDMVCLIEFNRINMTFETNRSAKKFNLINPPMYVNYNISKPFNVTGTRLITENAGKERTVSYSYYSPYSYLEFKVRNPTSGEIYLQDGFGTAYDSNLNKTIQINKAGNLLIEVNGNNVTSYVGYWVKPKDNINPESVNLSSLECRSQDYIKKLTH